MKKILNWSFLLFRSLMKEKGTKEAQSLTHQPLYFKFKLRPKIFEFLFHFRALEKAKYKESVSLYFCILF